MSSLRHSLAAGLGLAVAATGLQFLAPSVANAASTGLVISEVYGGGGNSGATWRNDFIELYNPTAAPISLAGMSVQYRAAGGTGTGVTALTGTVPPGAHFLVQEAAGSGGTKGLPHPDATGSLAMGGASGVAFLANTTSVVTVAAGSIPASVIDLVGYGAASVFEGASAAPGTALTNNQSAERK